MIISKINYLNLLVFNIFIKKYIQSSQHSSILEYKKDVPSKININLTMRRIDAGFISSIASKNHKCLNLGIIAKKDIQSVLVCKGEHSLDSESATSNILASILNLKGNIIIGDKALQRYFKDSSCIDLALKWYQKYTLPFVFARFCYNKHKNYFINLEKNFKKKRVLIPQYIIKKEAKYLNLNQNIIKSYLSKIEYNLDIKAQKSLKLFLKKSKNISI